MELLGLVIFFVILAVSLPTIMYMQHRSLVELRAETAAAQFNEIAQAADNYIASNYNYLLQTSNGSPLNISVNQLQQGGFLSPDLLPENSYGQTWEVQVSQQSPGALQGIITTSGGDTLNQQELGLIIAQTHGVGGEILPPATSLNGDSDNGSIAYGAYGGWQLDFSQANYQNPGQGHLVGLLTYVGGSSTNNDYLYRSVVPGQPQLNTMQTNIDMGNNNINNVSAIQTGIPDNTSYAASSNGCGGHQDAEGHCTGQIMAASTSESAMPSGWQGGLVTRDIYSQNGTIAVGPGAQNTPNSDTSVLASLDDGGNVSPLIQRDDGGRITLTTEDSKYFARIFTSDYSQQQQSLYEGPNASIQQIIAANSPSLDINYYGTQNPASLSLYANKEVSPGVYETGVWSGMNVSSNSSIQEDAGLSMENGAPNAWTGQTYYDPNPEQNLTSGVDTTNTLTAVAAQNGYGDYAGVYATNGTSHQASVRTNGYIQPGNIAVDGAACQNNGALGSNQNGNGDLFSCINNVWTNVTGNQDFNYHNGVLVGSFGGSGSMEWTSTFDYPTIVTVNSTCSYSDGGVGSTVCTKSNLCWVGFAEGQYAKGYGQSFSFSNIVPPNGHIIVQGNQTCAQDVYAIY